MIPIFDTNTRVKGECIAQYEMQKYLLNSTENIVNSTNHKFSVHFSDLGINISDSGKIIQNKKSDTRPSTPSHRRIEKKNAQYYNEYRTND